MHLTQYVLPAAVLSTGVNAFYPYIRLSTAAPSLTSRLVERFYPFHLGVSASSDDVTPKGLTLPLKKRSTVVCMPEVFFFFFAKDGNANNRTE